MYKLNPLELGIDFENRHYELFDTIDVRLDLKPDGDGDVRKGRVDLVYVEVPLRPTPQPPGLDTGQRLDAGMGGRTLHLNTGTAHMAEGHEETYIHSSVLFLKETRLRGGGPSTHRAGLRIEPVLRGTSPRPQSCSATPTAPGRSNGDWWRRSTSSGAGTRRDRGP